ncbi:toxin glutamine deamidase domain-containing protein [Streptomyces sp. NPDC088785]|uniref:toxin glutamine deamidase domain-containing protein n=1 Tax=Streptomyces sp. NPDC088785 TaxID=3365897 RepID=UPI003804E028
MPNQANPANPTSTIPPGVYADPTQHPNGKPQNQQPGHTPGEGTPATPAPAPTPPPAPAPLSQGQSLQEIRDSLNHAPYGLLPPDPADQQALLNAVPRNPDGTPQRHPDPNGTWAQLQNDGGISQPGRSNNCLDNARSGLSTWFGDPQVAAPRTPDTNPDGSLDTMSPERDSYNNLDAWAGRPQIWAGADHPNPYGRIAQHLQQAGPGSAAVVGVQWPGGGGHAFNVYNHNGNIIWVDHQTGQVSPNPIHTGAAGVRYVPFDSNGQTMNAPWENQGNTTTSNATTSNATTSNATTSNATTSNATTSNATPSATPSNGTPGGTSTTTPGATSSNTTPGNSSSATTPNGTPNGATPNGATPNGATPNGATPNGTPGNTSPTGTPSTTTSNGTPGDSSTTTSNTTPGNTSNATPSTTPTPNGVPGDTSSGTTPNTSPNASPSTTQSTATPGDGSTPTSAPTYNGTPGDTSTPASTTPHTTPPGQTPSGQTPPTTTPPGQTPPTTTPPTTTPPGQTPTTTTPPTTTPPGQTPPPTQTAPPQQGPPQPGQTPPGQTSPGQTPPGQTPPGQPQPGQTPSYGAPSKHPHSDDDGSAEPPPKKPKRQPPVPLEPEGEGSTPYGERQPGQKQHSHYSMLPEGSQDTLRHSHEVSQIDTDVTDAHLRRWLNDGDLEQVLDPASRPNGNTGPYTHAELSDALPGFADLTPSERGEVVATLARLSLDFHRQNAVGHVPLGVPPTSLNPPYANPPAGLPQQNDISRGVHYHAQADMFGVKSNGKANPSRQAYEHAEEVYGPEAVRKMRLTEAAGTSGNRPDFTARNYAVVEVFNPQDGQTYYLVDSSIPQQTPDEAHSEPHLGNYLDLVNSHRQANGMPPIEARNLYTEREPCGDKSGLPKADCSKYIHGAKVFEGVPVGYATGFRKGALEDGATAKKSQIQRSFSRDFQENLNRKVELWMELRGAEAL